jgi:prolyl oligopeptidase
VASQAPESPVFTEVQVGRDIDTDVLVGPEGRLYLRTTDNAPRRRLCVADQPAPDVENWRELISERADATLERVALVDAELLACWSRRGISELTTHDPATGSLLRRVELPGKGRIIKATMEQEGDRLHFAYSEVSRSTAVLPYDRARAVIEPGLGGLSEPRAQVQWHRSLVTAADGTEVPVTVLSTASIATGPLPTILHVYGSYGRTRDFGFSATVLAWLQAGGQYAVAHVRGGGEHGASWHRAGSRAGKLTATADLVAVGEWLRTSGYATPEQTCLSGGSAGGVLGLSAADARSCGAR